MPPKYLHFEKDFYKKGFKSLVGIDEAGRGPLAGPVVAAAIILNPKNKITNLNDSKLLNEDKREQLYEEIMAKADAVSFAIVGEKIIDEVNILKATFIAMKTAVNDIKIEIDFILVDGDKEIPNIKIPQKAIISGDKICSSISAASIIAKVERDRIMKELDKKYPQYGFFKNKGYGTEEHMQALYEHGPSPYHRKSFNLSKQLKLF